MSTKVQWIVWSATTLALVAFLAYSMLTQSSSTARTFLPGVTTHGHYQIELQCQSCHTPGMGVQQDACTRCHGAELKQATDTHPRSKFTDPSKAHLLKELDARYCITCHQEHVPDRTVAMGLSLPTDYCWHCHQDVGEQRPSHKAFAYDSCATAGCHNYHDNRALFENFLVSHSGEPEMLDVQRLADRTFGAQWREEHDDVQLPLTVSRQDGPKDGRVDDTLLHEWETTAHAAAGVNCTDCHSGEDGSWYDHPSHEACRRCHERQVDGFLAGRHGMRLAAGLSPMTPSGARRDMKRESAHRELTCAACHESHRFDTQFAAVDACLQCHNDAHSLAYESSMHYELWLSEQSGAAEAGTGVSCAACHLPRLDDDEGGVFVQHNQNDNLRPNEKMVRTVCQSCHGLQFSLDALADNELVRRNFAGRPKRRVTSIDLAVAWSEERARLRDKRKKSKDGSSSPNDGAE